jgi:hypothetical protein
MRLNDGETSRSTEDAATVYEAIARTAGIPQPAEIEVATVSGAITEIRNRPFAIYLQYARGTEIPSSASFTAGEFTERGFPLVTLREEDIE